MAVAAFTFPLGWAVVVITALLAATLLIPPGRRGGRTRISR